MDLIKRDLSFIIPCHNLEDYICSLLDSFLMLNTNGLEVEYIFVLDDCEDGTYGKIRKKMKGLPYKIVDCNVHSCGLARNVGLEYASGEFIWFVDGDDQIVQRHFLPQLIGYMREHDLSLVRIKYTSNEDSLLNVLYETVWQFMIRRDLIGDTRFDEKQPGEDTRFMHKLFQKRNIKNINEIPMLNDKNYYYYRYYRPDSNMSQFNKYNEIKY